MQAVEPGNTDCLLCRDTSAVKAVEADYGSKHATASSGVQQTRQILDEILWQLLVVDLFLAVNPLQVNLT